MTVDEAKVKADQSIDQPPALGRARPARSEATTAGREDTMKPYFRLASDCFFVEGARDGALYDVTGQRLLVLDRRLHALLRRCEKNVPLESSWCGAEDRRRLVALEDEGVGCFDAEPSFVDKFVTHAPLRKSGFLEAIQFHKINWTITNRCEVGCAFCPRAVGDLTWQSCMTCLRAPGTASAPAALAGARGVVDQIAGLGVRVLHIRGGNPLLEWDRLQSIVEAAGRHRGLKVLITVPGAGRMPTDVVALGRTSHVMLNLVLFDPALCANGEAPQRDCFDRQQELAARLRTESVRFSVTLLGHGGTVQHLAHLRQWGQELAARSVAVAEIKSARDAARGARLCGDDTVGKYLVRWRNPEEFYLRVGQSPCLAGQCDIRSDGSIHPCAGIDACCGHVTGDLPKDLAGRSLYDRWWKLTKDLIEPCRRCALRYACVDCAAPAVTEDGGAARVCPFDPDGSVSAHDATWHHGGFVHLAPGAPVRERSA